LSRKIEILTNQRVFICGQTGSGKSFLASHLTQLIKETRLVVLDPKGEIDPLKWNLEGWTEESKRRLQGGELVRLHALLKENADPRTYWLSIMEDCYKAGNLVIYIDESYLANGGPTTTPPPIVNTLYALGRSFGIGVWAVSQRPTWIPIIQMSESQHFFVFRLNMPDDRRRMAEITGMPELEEQIYDDHGFWYARSGDRTPEYHARYQPSKRAEIDVEAVEPPSNPHSKRSKLLWNWI
jgi:energy-coupling factor transporter ATP-binding protein EcfA2